MKRLTQRLWVLVVLVGFLASCEKESSESAGLQENTFESSLLETFKNDYGISDENTINLYGDIYKIGDIRDNSVVQMLIHEYENAPYKVTLENSDTHLLKTKEEVLAIYDVKIEEAPKVEKGAKANFLRSYTVGFSRLGKKGTWSFKHKAPRCVHATYLFLRSIQTQNQGGKTWGRLSYETIRSGRGTNTACGGNLAEVFLYNISVETLTICSSRCFS